MSAAELPVHVWYWHLDIDETTAGRLAGYLSEDEVERAGRFVTRDLQRRWIAARAGMREILARSLGVEPCTLTFGAGEHGRPFLKGVVRAPSFNLSHSETLAVLALCETVVGADVERVKEVPEGVAGMMFSAPEIFALEAMAPDQQAPAFYRCWTAKEAVLKALGTGLSLSSRSFTIDYAEPSSLELVSAEWHHTDVSPWQLRGFDPAPGYTGAVAVRSLQPVSLRMKQWTF